MQPLYYAEITKFNENGKELFEDDLLAREIKLEIFVNSKFLTAIMAIPLDQDALSVSYLISEGIIKSVDDIEKIEVLDDGIKVEIAAKIDEEKFKNFSLNSVIISGCGRSNTANINIEAMQAKIIESKQKFSKDLILSQMSKFYTQCELYEQTGCVHTAKIYFNEDKFFIGEDIAQHNTIDKALGKALLKGEDVKNGFLMVSGRLSSEMVAKAVMHQIPLLVSRTAPTSLGVMIAKKFNLTLCGFARGSRMNVYSGVGRIYE